MRKTPVSKASPFQLSLSGPRVWMRDTQVWESFAVYAKDKTTITTTKPTSKQD